MTTTNHEALEDYMQTIPTDLLIRVAKGEFDVAQIARQLVAERGINPAGDWVGFSKAAYAWDID